MASVGGVSCTFVHDAKGGIPPLRQRSETWHATGIDGYGIQLLGKGESEFTVRAVLYSNNAGIDTWAALLHAMQGLLVVIIDDHGTTYTYCYLKTVGNVAKTPAKIPGGEVTTRGEIKISGCKTQ